MFLIQCHRRVFERIEDNHFERENVAKQVVDSVATWLPTLHVLVVGPGLGRDSFTQYCTKQIISKAKEAQIPLLIDGVRHYLNLLVY